MGVIFIPSKFIDNLENGDHLNRIETKSKLIYSVARQLIKHWFYNYVECDYDNDRSFHSESESESMKFDLTIDTINVIRNFLENQIYVKNERLLNQLLESNEKCYIYKGLIGWISYLAFKSQQADFFDLYQLEWSLIRRIDEMDLFDNQNINYIYQAYEFPRLTEATNFNNIKTEIRVNTNRISLCLSPFVS